MAAGALRDCYRSAASDGSSSGSEDVEVGRDSQTGAVGDRPIGAQRPAPGDTAASGRHPPRASLAWHTTWDLPASVGDQPHRAAAVSEAGGAKDATHGAGEDDAAETDEAGGADSDSDDDDALVRSTTGRMQHISRAGMRFSVANRSYWRR